MSNTRIEQMLQECLDGYEAGLTPEECLSAYPRSRVELEPLLRQALSLRVAYATSPGEEFRHQAREQLLFAAGRDVELALANEPDPNFILQERTRFLNVAGAAAQEALRDVPPPRLAFWINARRRLLEAAASTSPSPGRRIGSAMRYSLSAAVVAIAIAVGAYASLSGGGSPSSADAQLAALEEQIMRVERLTLEGQPVSAGELEELADRTSQITSSLSEQDLERAEKIGGLILRQQEVARQFSPDQPDLAEAQQKLAEAQQKLDSAKGVTPTVAAAAAASTEEPAVAVTEDPEPTPTPDPLEPGEVLITSADDDDYGLTWQRVTTTNVTFVIPDDWDLITVQEDENGVPRQIGTLAFQTSGETPIIVLVTDYGQAIAQVDGVALQLRGPGVDGDTIAPETLAARGEVGLPLHHFVLSINTTGTP